MPQTTQESSVGATGSGDSEWNGHSSSRDCLGSIPLQPGESVESEFERPLSAPPPPGFGEFDPEQRTQLAENQLLWGVSNGRGDGNNSSEAQGAHLGFTSDSGGGRVRQGSDASAGFKNLAAVLGSVLPEWETSSGPAKESNHYDNQSYNPTSNSNNALSDNYIHPVDPPSKMFNAGVVKKDDPSLKRQARHTAIGNIGASPSLQGDPILHPTAVKAPTTNANAYAAPMVSPSQLQHQLTGNFQWKEEGARGGDNERGAYSRAPGPALVSSQAHEHQQNSQQHNSWLSSSQQQPLNAGTAEENDATGQRREALRGSTTPVQMFPGQTGDPRRALPANRDIGMNVIEPEKVKNAALGEVISQRMDTATNAHRSNNVGLHASQQFQTNKKGGPSMWAPAGDVKDFKPSTAPVHSRKQHNNYSDALSVDNSTISDSDVGSPEVSASQLEAELGQHTWAIDQGKPSRTLVILHVSWLPAPDVRSECEKFGVLESFRLDFADRAGIYFASYYDIRSAQYAALELQARLQRLSVMQRSNEAVQVRYCVPMNSSTRFDESQILASELPLDIDENKLMVMLSSYGPVRSILPQSEGSFLIEFFNVQDTKQALLELNSSEPWGPGVNVEEGLRNPAERKKGKELLALLSRWRQNLGQQSRPTVPTTAPGLNPDAVAEHYPSTVGSSGQPEPWRHGGGQTGGFDKFHPQQQPQLYETRYKVGPNGNYTPVIEPQQVSSRPSYGSNNHGQSAGPRSTHQQSQLPQQQFMQGPDGQIYVIQVAPAPTVHSQEPHVFRQPPRHPPTIDISPPIYRYPYFPQPGDSSVSGRSDLSGRSDRSGKSTNDNHLLLDLDVVESGRDPRTSLMVRNIPNKYSQQMLLSEFEENGHGPGVIDFFYLPIDFKNRCNRGYAFINFVECKDILAFHRRYFGKHWRTFNSDKICDITYARIQGKQAMLKRFENSALMGKDEEYKPLVFVSDGPEKGKRLPFPTNASGEAIN